MSDPVPRPPRPVLRADLVALIGGSQDADPAMREELAAATAAVVVSVGREGGDPSRLVNLADEVGLDTLGELWRDAGPDTLPGALWAVYLLRTWCRAHAEEVARLWRAGRPYAPADEVVAGVADDADPGAMAAVADAVLSGAYRGDFAVALERAAAFFRVIAAGRRELAPEGADGSPGRELAERNDRVADGLTSAAHRWRSDSLH